MEAPVLGDMIAHRAGGAEVAEGHGEGRVREVLMRVFASVFAAPAGEGARAACETERA